MVSSSKDFVDSAASSGKDSDSDSDSDGAPEVVSSKAPLETSVDGGGGPPGESTISDDEDDAKDTTEVPARAAQQSLKKPRPKQPRRPPYNPFAQRPSLLRNVSIHHCLNDRNTDDLDPAAAHA